MSSAGLFSRLYNLLLAAVVFLLFFCLLELGARAYLMTTTGFDVRALLYGAGEDYLTIHSLTSASFDDPMEETQGVSEQYPLDYTEFEMEGFCGCHQKLGGNQATARVIYESDLMRNILSDPRFAGRKIVFWAFGGSTTQGSFCSKDASSWPAELEKLDPEHITVINYGRNGTSSDQSIDRLTKLLTEESAPDFVLWANGINEVDVLYFLMDRNIERLAARFPELGERPETLARVKQRNAYRHFLTGLKLSLEKRLALFRVMNDLFAIYGSNMNLEQMRSLDSILPLGDRAAEFCFENYRINADELRALGEKYGFNPIAVRLARRNGRPVRTDIPTPEAYCLLPKVESFCDRYYEKVGLPFINVNQTLIDAGLLAPGVQCPPPISSLPAEN
ncbi:MAG: SGNH/GDSL hydrolase family protein [Desulfovibrionaceae bacterium]